MPQPDDAYSAMLALSTQLAAMEAAGQRLSTGERIIADIVWTAPASLGGAFVPDR